MQNIWHTLTYTKTCISKRINTKCFWEKDWYLLSQHKVFIHTVWINEIVKMWILNSTLYHQQYTFLHKIISSCTCSPNIKQVVHDSNCPSNYQQKAKCGKQKSETGLNSTKSLTIRGFFRQKPNKIISNYQQKATKRIHWSHWLCTCMS